MSDRPQAEKRSAGRGVLIGVVVVLAVAFGIRTVVRVLTQDEKVFRADLATAFFERYVEPDGRVVRRDQGSDTVSEGQAYAMLLAVAADDAARFESVWRWTRDELQRSDGLLSWRWTAGRIADEQPATDADIDAAYALMLAGERFGKPSYLNDARQIARGILDEETIDAGDRRILLAGPWARRERIVNPSYIAPEAFRRFAEAFGDDRWEPLARDGMAMIRSLTDGGKRKPPDWARVDENGNAVASSSPGATGAAAEGLESARVMIRFASSCDDEARQLAAASSDVAAADLHDGSHALEYVAAGAAAFAAGNTERAESLLGRAERVVRSEPTYYGSAWVALGRAMLDPRALRSCPGGPIAAEFVPGFARARTA